MEGSICVLGYVTVPIQNQEKLEDTSRGT